MSLEDELAEAITDLMVAIKKFSGLIDRLGNKRLSVAYREHVLKGFYHFCQECALLFGAKLGDIE